MAAKSLATTIRADGVDWPILTFLDAYGYQPVDRFIRPDLEGGRRICLLDDAGEIRGPTFVDQVDWHGIVAWRAADPLETMPACFLCGTSLDPASICEDCFDQAEFDA